MKRISLPIGLAATVLAACTISTLPVWLKPGTPVVQAQADLAQCRAEADRIAVSQRGSRFNIGVGVGVRLCDGPFCASVNNRPGGAANQTEATIRRSALIQCMGARGYSETTLPRCAADQTKLLATHPFDTRGVCATPGGALASR